VEKKDDLLKEKSSKKDVELHKMPKTSQKDKVVEYTKAVPKKSDVKVKSEKENVFQT
jgi:hypothetical protein